MNTKGPPWALVLVALLFVGWFANGVVIAIYGTNAELYPLTAYHMFSGGTSETSSANYLVAEDGRELLTMEAYHPDRRIPATYDTAIVSKLIGSYRHGCDSLRHSPYTDCPGEPVEEWRLPSDLTRQWGDTLTVRFGLNETPDVLDLVSVEVRIADGVETDRLLLFQFVTGTGEILETGLTP